VKGTCSLALGLFLLAATPVVNAYDRLGSDLGTGLPVTSPNQCNTLCNGNPACQAWVFVAAGNTRFTNTTPLCFLKKAIPPPSSNATCPSNAACLSGVKRTDGWCGEDPTDNVPGTNNMIPGQGDVLTCAAGVLCAPTQTTTTRNKVCWFLFIPYPCHEQVKLKTFDEFCATGVPTP